MFSSIHVFGELLQTTFALDNSGYQLRQVTHPGGVHLLAKALIGVIPNEFKPSSTQFNSIDADLSEDEVLARTARGSRLRLAKCNLSSRDSRKISMPMLQCWRTKGYSVDSDHQIEEKHIKSYSIPVVFPENTTAGQLFLVAPGKFLDDFTDKKLFTKQLKRNFQKNISSDNDIIVLLASKLNQITLVSSILAQIKVKPRFFVIISSRAFSSDIDLPQDTTHEFAIHKVASYLTQKQPIGQIMTESKCEPQGYMRYHGVNTLVVRLSNSGVAVFREKTPYGSEDERGVQPSVDGSLIFDGKRPVPLKEPGIGTIESYGYLYLLSFAKEWMNSVSDKHMTDDAIKKFVEDATERANLVSNLMFLNGFAKASMNSDLNLRDWKPYKPLVESINAADALRASFHAYINNGKDDRDATKFLVSEHRDVVESQVKILIPFTQVLAPEIIWRGTSIGMCHPSAWLAGYGTVVEGALNSHFKTLYLPSDQGTRSGQEKWMETVALRVLGCIGGDDAPMHPMTPIDRIKNLACIFRPACIGKLKLADRREIEDYLFLQNLLIDYEADSKNRKPLSIAVFGPPGSGKSFGVKQLVKGLNDSGANFQKDEIEFNLSQLQTPGELASALHKVRNACLADGIPLVFFDEFDTALHGTPFYWLKYFLAPMQDGNFIVDGTHYILGKAVFVFAGGVNQSFSEMNGRSRNAEFCQAKGPDFLSRLRGVLNIRGINSSVDLSEIGMHKVKRAVLLRSDLNERVKHASVKPIDTKLAHAFLQIPSYRHGVRSMQAIVKMSHIAAGETYKPADLPPRGQLDIHVDARSFMEIINP